MPSPPLLALHNVSMRFADRLILNNVSLSLHRNQIVTIIGPNGAGKSTLIKLVLGLNQPTQGEIARQKGLRFGYVPQKVKLNDDLPLQVHRFLKLAGHCKDEASLLATLQLVGAPHLLHANMHTLSGGEMQRVLLANAVLNKPDVLVLDEPTQGVDFKGQLELYDLFMQLKSALQCAILVVSHDLHLVMAKTDEVICLQQHICCQGTPQAIVSHPSYLALFGPSAQQRLAIYQHHHDHEHNLAGAPICSHQHHGEHHV
ncbi:MAG: zinc ABC transporter ATP-binding protein ZnuC [Enterovibrio sp.]